MRGAIAGRRAWIVMVLAIWLTQPLPAAAQVPLVQPDIEVKCTPRKLYCGDTLTIDIKGSHAGTELAIGQDYFRDVYLLTFRPGPKDKIPPVIAPDVFARMTRLRLRTDRAVGSPADGWMGDCVPRVKGPPELIFTASGGYQVTVGYQLFSPGVDYEAPLPGCKVDYFDFRRPKPGQKPDYEHLCHPGAEDARQRKDHEEVREEDRGMSVRLKCEPQVLYRGDTLTVDMLGPHDDDEFAIMRGVEHPATASDYLLMSFKPNPPDTVAPVIPFDKFRGMKQVRIATTEAKGSPAWGGNDGPCFKRVDQPPQRIFTRSGEYAVAIGQSLGGLDEGEASSCVVHYIDRPRPAQPAR
jgi:hypothetical protein